MCQYFSYFSASAVRIFWMFCNEKGQEGDQNYANGFSKIFFAVNGTFWTQKWHVPLDLLKNPSKRSGENYQEILPQTEQKLLKKPPQKLIFFLPVASFHVFQHLQTFPILGVTLLMSPQYHTSSLSSGVAHMKVSPRTWRDILLKIFSSINNLTKTIKDERGQEVHETFIKGGGGWKLY